MLMTLKEIGNIVRVPPTAVITILFWNGFISILSHNNSSVCTLTCKTGTRLCCDIGQFHIGKNRCQDDIFPRIELFPLSSLSSDNTNCKNDIQLFHQLFDELSVYRDYH